MSRIWLFDFILAGLGFQVSRWRDKRQCWGSQDNVSRERISSIVRLEYVERWLLMPGRTWFNRISEIVKEKK